VHFWLCAPCAASMTLVLEPERGLKLVAVHAQEADTTRGSGNTQDALPTTEC
jgi:hypothetical protein